MMKRTDQLKPGERVMVNGHYLRHARSATESSWVNFRNQTIFNDWSDGNSGIAFSEWEMAS